MRTPLKKDILGWLFVALVLALTGCVPTTPRLDSEFGMAVSMARMQQTANPNPSHNDPVKGIDGQAGDAAFDSYRESFMNPQPALSGGVLNVGTGRAGSGGGMGSR
ncbi:MAG: tRNA dimethylallyltransferase [Nitrosospira sp.]